MKPIKHMNKEEFCVYAIRTFSVDVNDFGHEVAAKLLIELMKSYHAESKPYSGTGSDYLDCVLGIGGFEQYGPLNDKDDREEAK